MLTVADDIMIFPWFLNTLMYLSEVVQSLVEVSQHASGGLIGDLDGRLKYTLYGGNRCFDSADRT